MGLVRVPGCGDYGGVGVVVLLVAAGFAIWWLTGHKKWGTGGKLLFWAVLVAVLWVLVTRYSAPHPQG